MPTTKQKEKKQDSSFEFKGKYTKGLGRRKTSTSQVRLYSKGKGIIEINKKKLTEYLPQNLINIVNQPLKLTSHLKDFDISVVAKGGGKKAQASAIRHGIARALIAIDEELRPKLKAKGWLTRDARKKERKKPGLKKARRAPQWSKR